MCHWQACRNLIKTPREYGHQAVNVVHHVYDRAVLAPLTRLHHQLLYVLFDQAADNQDEGDAYLSWLTTWFSTSGCFAHDCHVGLKWSILSFIADKTVMRSCFISIESLRNGYSVMMRHVGGWLGQVVRYCDWLDVDAESTYKLLGVQEDWLESVSYTHLTLPTIYSV